jgi:hypothetical protein
LDEVMTNRIDLLEENDQTNLPDTESNVACWSNYLPNAMIVELWKLNRSRTALNGKKFWTSFPVGRRSDDQEKFINAAMATTSQLNF